MQPVYLTANVSLCVYVEAKVPFLKYRPPSLVLWDRLSLAWNLPGKARLADQQVPGIHLPPNPHR